MPRAKVLVFLTSNLSVETGSTIAIRNSLMGMAQTPNTDVVVAFSGPPSIGAHNREILLQWGFNSIFIPFRITRQMEPVRSSETVPRFIVRANHLLLDKFYFWGERETRQQRHVDAAFGETIRRMNPNVVVVDGIFSAFYVPSAFQLATPCCLISQNNEIPLYRDLKSYGGLAWMTPFELWIFRHFNWIANTRVRAKINHVYKQCAGIVTLTRNDLPKDLPSRVVRAVISPILQRSDLRWRYSGRRCILFVGNIFAGTTLHFPNRIAIEWICRKLAPELARIDDSIQINIIGARPDQIERSWQQVNTHFLGRADNAELMIQMTTADIFIAPIANNYGAKMKLAECVSHGMPFIATEGAMSGLPFLDFVPRVKLDQPAHAAGVVVSHINEPGSLMSLSEAITACAERACREQRLAWANFLGETLMENRRGEADYRVTA